jgi:hypothetical protein
MSVITIALILGLCSVSRLIAPRTPVSWNRDDCPFENPDEPDEPAPHVTAGDWRIVFARHLFTAQLVVDRLDAAGVTEFECTALSPTAFVVLWRVPPGGAAPDLGLHVRRW